MTNSEMEKLASMIAKKIYAKALDEEKKLDQFGGVEFAVLMDEFGRLKQLLDRYEEDEEYEKAMIVKNRMDKIIIKVQNL
jgi:hypothetical protein